MQSRSLRFAESVRVLSVAARGSGLDVPAIRSRPRRDDVDRTIRRRPSGEAIVAVRLEDRPFPAVQADLIESFVVTNQFGGADAALLRSQLWTALDESGQLDAVVEAEVSASVAAADHSGGVAARGPLTAVAA